MSGLLFVSSDDGLGAVTSLLLCMDTQEEDWQYNNEKKASAADILLQITSVQDGDLFVIKTLLHLCH